MQEQMMLGKAALHRGDRRAAAAYLLAAADSPPSSTYENVDMTLARALVDWGERETVARFLDKCAAFSNRSEPFRRWATEIRKGINPDLIPYATGCAKDPC